MGRAKLISSLTPRGRYVSVHRIFAIDSAAKCLSVEPLRFRRYHTYLSYLSTVRRTFDFELPPYVCLSNIRSRIRRSVSVRQTFSNDSVVCNEMAGRHITITIVTDDGPVTITITHNITQCHAAGYRDGNTIALTSLISNTVASVSHTVAAQSQWNLW